MGNTAREVPVDENHTFCRERAELISLISLIFTIKNKKMKNMFKPIRLIDIMAAQNDFIAAFKDEQSSKRNKHTFERITCVEKEYTQLIDEYYKVHGEDPLNLIVKAKQEIRKNTLLNKNITLQNQIMLLKKVPLQERVDRIRFLLKDIETLLASV